MLGFLWIVSAGALSDKVGRKNMFISGCAFGGVRIHLLRDARHRHPWVIFLAVALSLLPVMTQYGPGAALIAKNFSPRLRYSGTSLGYQFALIIAGGPSPIIAT